MAPSTLFFSALALSSAVLTAPLAPRSESWPVPSMKAHFMGRDTGIPGNNWSGHEFNSTLDFSVSFPSGAVACSGNWKYTQVPTTPFACAAEGVQFALSPTRAGTFSETAFTLTVTKTETDASTGSQKKLVGSHEIVGNSPGTPNSYLSCVGGAPFDGIRCDITGWASTAGSLTLVAA